MLTPEQAKQLREAGLTAYNHNLDTSPEYYSKITSSRKYEVGTLHPLILVNYLGIERCGTLQCLVEKAKECALSK